MEKIVIIGGGAAGMAAGIFLGEQGHKVHIFEKNEKLGKKLFITGKGRCNLTNSCDEEAFFQSVVTNAKFLYSSFYGFTNQNVISFFEDLGLKLKEERGGRIFPVSDHSSDVIGALEKKLHQLDVKIHLKSQVQEIWTDEDGEGEKKVRGVLLENGEKIEADRVIVATGGCSYQATGSTGGWLPFCTSQWTYCYGNSSCFGSDRDRRGLYYQYAGTFSEKCRADHKGWKKSPVQKFWRTFVYAFWNVRSPGAYRQLIYWKTAAEGLSAGNTGFKAGLDQGTVG